MNEIVEETKIENMIYEIKGKQVMLDSYLAKLYHCVNGSKTINQAVKRNIERFPCDFYFQLTNEEFDNLKFQFGTSSWNNYGGISYYNLWSQTGTTNRMARSNPYVFTEQGVAMLAAILRTVAEEVSVRIMRAFVLMRKYISSSLIEQRYINNLVLEHEERLKIVETTFSSFKEK